MSDLLNGIAAFFPENEIFNNIAARWIAFLGLIFIVAIMVFPKGVVGTVRDYMSKRNTS